MRGALLMGGCCLVGLLTSLSVSAAEKNVSTTDTRVFEVRVYYAAEGKLDALHARFRNHTVKLFEKHGITNVGYFVPVGENPDRILWYVLAYPNREARDKAWDAFKADPDWQKAYKESEVNGKLVAKVDQYFLNAADYSPLIKASVSEGRVFELRTYTASEGNLDALHNRFRQHTVKLFAKHGMTNVAYWTLMPDQKEAKTTLMYLLAHASQDAAKASFGAFGKDPDWVAARTASEQAAGGSLTAKGGVKSLFMKATDYSPIK